MVELLAPVRNEVSFRAAIEAGAGAVYFGVGQLNMRINSKGIDLDKLPDITAQAHRRKVKVYVTVNAIVYDHEMTQLDELLSRIARAGADAVICWDLAVIERAKRLALPIHISTQASVSNSDAAAFYEKLGAVRIVPARELSLEQIKTIKDNTSLEIEVFVHGAMCVSVSGRCFMSQFLHGRSANRGDCLQPCRAEYQVINKENGTELQVGNGYILSPKDLCCLPIIDKLMDTGIDSFKIEGRSRPPEYIYCVVGAYRKAIDAVENGCFNQKLIEELQTEVSKVYNRGFSQGFLLGRPGGGDWTDRRGGQASARKIYVGQVLNYYKKTKIAYGSVIAESLAVGDTVQIHGPQTGIVEFQITNLMTDDDRTVQSIERGKATFPSEPLLRRNDQIFKVVTNEQ
jgi:U32 family peptidase